MEKPAPKDHIDIFTDFINSELRQMPPEKYMAVKRQIMLTLID